MMKIFTLLIFICCSFLAMAAEKKKVSDKIYTVPASKPQIEIGSVNEEQDTHEKHRPRDPLYLGIFRSSLTYDAGSLVTNTGKFEPELAGISVAKKTNNRVFFKGQFEVGGSWQRFSRSSGTAEQKLNLFQLNIIQNINLLWTFRNTFFFTAGLGLAPVYLTAEKSVLGNSFSEIGVMVLLKLDALYPVSAHYEIDLGLNLGVGSIDGTSIVTPGVSLGMNFD